MSEIEGNTFREPVFVDDPGSNHRSYDPATARLRDRMYQWWSSLPTTAHRTPDSGWHTDDVAGRVLKLAAAHYRDVTPTLGTVRYRWPEQIEVTGRASAELVDFLRSQTAYAGGNAREVDPDKEWCRGCGFRNEHCECR